MNRITSSVIIFFDGSSGVVIAVFLQGKEI